MLQKLRKRRFVIFCCLTAFFIILSSSIIFFMKDLIFERFQKEVSWAGDIAMAGLNPSHISSAATLIGSNEFIESAEVKRLKKELESFGNLFLPRGVDAIYLTDKKGTEIYFIAESTPFGEEGYVIPGSLYREAPQAIYHVISSGQTIFTDLYTDEYGTYFSEFRPIFSEEGELISVLGVDISYDYFKAYLLKHRLIVFGVFLVLYLLFLFVIFLFRRRSDIEKQIIKSNQQIKAIIDSIPSSLIAFNSKGKIIFWNHACNDMFGLGSRDAVGKKIDDIVAFKSVNEQISGKQIKLFSFNNLDAYAKKKLEFILNRTKGEIVVEVSFNFFESDEEKMGVALFDDITLRKQKDQELEDQRQKVEKINSLIIDRELKMIELKAEIDKAKESCER